MMQDQTVTEYPISTWLIGAARNTAGGERRARDIDRNIPGTPLNSTIQCKSNVIGFGDSCHFLNLTHFI